MELIPGLTDDLARECLIRLPFQSYPSLLSVSKSWNREIRNSDFHRHRKLVGLTRPVFVLGSLKGEKGLVLLDPEPGILTRLPYNLS